MADVNHYFVRPVAGVWHVTWNESEELIGSYGGQPEAVAVAELLARHMSAQGRMAQVHVAEPQARRASWGSTLVNHHAA